MRTSGRGRWCAQLLAAVLISLVDSPTFAQSGGALPQTADTVKATSFETYQVYGTDSPYMPGRLRVPDANTGKVRAVRRTAVLVIRDGKIIARTQTGAGGVVQIKSLSPGPYSVIAVGPDGVGVFGMSVVPYEDSGIARAYRFDVILAPSADVAVGQKNLAEISVPMSPHAAPVGIPPALATANKDEEERQDGGLDPVSMIRDPRVTIRTNVSLQGQVVALDAKAGLAVPVGRATLCVIRAGECCETVRTDDDGKFTLRGDLKDGVYSIIGSGAAGFICTGCEVRTEGMAAATAMPTNHRYVSLADPANPLLGITAAGEDARPFAPGFGKSVPLVGDIDNTSGAMAGPGSLAAGGAGVGGSSGVAGGGGGLLGALLGVGLGAAFGGDGDGPQNPASPNLPPAGQ